MKNNKDHDPYPFNYFIKVTLILTVALTVVRYGNALIWLHVSGEWVF